MTAQPNDDGGPPATPEEILQRSVYSSDGRFLGKAVKLEEGWFRLDVPQEVDYWLPYDTVRAIVHDQVLLKSDRITARRQSRIEHPTSANRRLEKEEENRLYEWADAPAEDETQESTNGETNPRRKPFDWADQPAGEEAAKLSGDEPPRST